MIGGRLLAMVLAAAALGATGCGAALMTRRLPVSGLDEVDGLAVNHPVPQRVVMIVPEKPGTRDSLVVQETRALLPSSTEIYEVDYRGALFFSRQLEVELHEDGTLGRVKIVSTNQVPEALEQLSAAVKSAGEIQQALNPPAPPAPDPVAAQHAALEQQLKTLMLEANLRAVQEGTAPPYPGIGTPAK